jgi:peptidoglycan/xylan/chitin deacetylase (PgdA/CDA1 family)
LRRRGLELEWAEPRIVDSLGALLELCHARGASSVEIVRADPSLVTELEVGSWFDAGWRLRALRRLLVPAPFAPPRTLLALRDGFRLAADLAFWRGVRSRAQSTEWRRLVGSSYTALVYHRFADERKPGQDPIDLAPGAFDRQLRLLRLAGFRHLRALELLRFHEDASATVPRRSFVVTVDDGFADALEPLRRHVDAAIQLFVSTSDVGGAAAWADGEPLMTWEELRSLAEAGVVVASHGRHHRRFSGLPEAELEADLRGSAADLRNHLDVDADLLAYPHGDHDAAVRATVRRVGFRASFTTEKGRNGAGTDPYCLRRVSVHAGDGALAVLWKVITGEALPARWLRLRSRSRRVMRRSR